MRLATPLLLFTLAGALLGGCSKPEQRTEAPRPLPVATIEAHAADEPRWIELLGRAEGGQEVEVRAQVGGLLKSFSYREGDAVKEGDVLFTIEDAPFRAALDSAASARARAEVALEQSEREMKRTEGLYKAGSESRKALDDARSACEDARHALEAARAAERDARINLDWTRVRAPASGLAARAEVNPGALVSASTTLLTTITQRDRVRVLFSPSDRDLGKSVVTSANRVRVMHADGSEERAEIDYVAQSFDHTLGTLAMRAKLPETTRVMPGEFVRVRLMVDTDRGVFRIPQKAILQLPDGSYAVYVAENGKAHRRTVTVGLWEGTDWIVRSGLKEGELVITNQLLKLRDGSAVEPAAPASPAPQAS